ncbi:MAG: rhomboid family intramembrane serine protease [Paludibacter sp.]|jgi:membrane associated rhomboid family serine protease|nr:rhomboid family intramembrane serine protease [Paludibacter sp.]
MNVFSYIKQFFLSRDELNRLIVINVAIFLLVGAVNIFFTLFNSHTSFFDEIFALPAAPKAALYKAWTVITYMFFHRDFFHILFNMLMLYWFGKVFLIYFSEKQLVGLYLIGGFFGAAFFVFAFSVFPLFAANAFNTSLMGASAAVMAIVVASAVQMPNMAMRFFIIGSVKLKWIAAVAVLVSFWGITGKNAGGEISHLGGALAGWIFVVSLRSGKDITAWLNKIIDALVDLFKPHKKMKVSYSKNYNRKMTDAEFNMNKARNMEEIDRILDKIKASGYESLTKEEKQKLFEQKK